MADDAGDGASGRPDWNAANQTVVDPEQLRDYARLCDEQADRIDEVRACFHTRGPIPARAWSGWMELALAIHPSTFNVIAGAYADTCEATAIRLGHYSEALRTLAWGVRNTADDAEGTDTLSAQGMSEELR